MMTHNDATEPAWVEAKRIVERMEPWFRGINKRGRKPDSDFRTINEKCFDAGVFAASEMIRRLTGDEELALAIHEVCIWRQREHQINAEKGHRMFKDRTR